MVCIYTSQTIEYQVCKECKDKRVKPLFTRKPIERAIEVVLQIKSIV